MSRHLTKVEVEMPTDEDLQKLVESHPLEVVISGLSALHLLGALQLVLRHPEFINTVPAQTARKLAERLEAHIVAASPGMAQLCKEGWNPEAELSAGPAPTYLIGEKPYLPGETAPFIRWLICHRDSFNASDIEQKYCGFCQRFHEEQQP